MKITTLLLASATLILMPFTAIHDAETLEQRFELSFSMMNCAGWSNSGDPYI